jgi:Na+/melibiose symporter-like transporter
LRSRLFDAAHGRIAGALPSTITVDNNTARKGVGHRKAIGVNAGLTGSGVAGSAKVSVGRLVAYSTLQLPLAMAALPVVLNVSHFYGEVLKLSLEIMGPIFIVARLVDAIQDPVIGLLSDRFTHHGPRSRLLFVAMMLPALAGGFYMLFDPPDAWFGNQTLMAIWLMAGLLLVHFGYSGVSIGYHSHGAELTDDYNERTKVTVGREVFGLLGFAVAVVLPVVLTHPRAFGETQGYMVLGLLFIPLAAAFSLPTLLWAGPSVHPPIVHLGNPLLAFFAPLKNRLFQRLLLVFVVNGSALGAAVGVMLFYVHHVLLGTKMDAGIILLIYFVAGACSVPGWLVLSRRFGKATAWFVGMVLTAGAMAAALFVGGGQITLFMVISVFTGLGLGADYGLPPSILADVINSEEGGDTRGKTGTYFGLWALTTKVATAIGAFCSLQFLPALGFDPLHGQYGKFALIFAYIIVPVSIKVIAALLIWFIRIEATRGSVRKELLG